MTPRARSRTFGRTLAAAGLLVLPLAGPAMAQDDGSVVDENDPVGVLWLLAAVVGPRTARRRHPRRGAAARHASPEPPLPCRSRADLRAGPSQDVGTDLSGAGCTVQRDRLSEALQVDRTQRFESHPVVPTAPDDIFTGDDLPAVAYEAIREAMLTVLP
jgi:hypothetical protein